MKRFVALAALLLAFGAAAQEKAIDARITVKAPVAEVFKTWTTSEGIRTFFAPDGNVQLRVDGPFEIFFNPLDQPGRKGADGMRILAFQQDRMLSFTWNAPPSLPEARQQRTVVILRFKPVGDAQTEVTLNHVGWGDGGEWDKAYDYFSKVWPRVLASLKARFETGPLDFTEWMKQMREGMEKAEKARKDAEAEAAAQKK